MIQIFAKSDNEFRQGIYLNMFWIMRGSLKAGDNFWCLKSYGRQREGSICHMSLLYARCARQTRTNTETLPKVWDFIIPRRFSWCCVIIYMFIDLDLFYWLKENINFSTCFFKFPDSGLFVRNPRLAQIHGCRGGMEEGGQKIHPAFLAQLIYSYRVQPILFIWASYRAQPRWSPNSRMRRSMWES